MSQPSFAMMSCAYGAEKAVKKSMADDGWRLAFSRPGFVTAKHDAPGGLPTGIFIRTAAHSLGHSKNSDGSAQLQSLLEILDQSQSAQRPFDHLHVWPRDRAPIGRFGFEPGIDEVAAAVAQEIHSVIRDKYLRCASANEIAQPDQRVLDIVLVDPSDWFVGWHTADTWPTRWPGGVQPLQPKHEPISRAYYKAAEAIAWSGFDIQPGDRVIEVGSAPGGACGRLLEIGCRVTGIDPADMDERIANHPKLTHIKARAGDLPRKTFTGAKWLLVDSNVKPEKTLTTVEHIVTHQYCTLSGLLVTMKLGDYDKMDQIPVWLSKVQRWNPKQVAVRQLARNRCEVCLAVSL